MSQTRVYLPLRGAQVAALASVRSLEGTPLEAYAVTHRLERRRPGLDPEEYEYLALCEAALAASAMRERPGERRVVAAADVEPRWLVPREDGQAGSDAGVSVSEPVPLSRVVALHVDEAGAGESEELLWYDVTELDTVVAMFR